MYSIYCKFSFSIFGKSIDTEIKPTFRIDSVWCFESIINTAKSILVYYGYYMKFSHLPDKLNITWLKIGVNMNISFPWAKVKFIGSGWYLLLFLAAFIFIHSDYYKDNYQILQLLNTLTFNIFIYLSKQHLDMLVYSTKYILVRSGIIQILTQI